MFRRAILALAGLFCLTAPTCAFDAWLENISPSWVLPGNPTIDLNFANGRYFGVPLSQLTTVRASASDMAPDSNGNYTTFPANTPRITSGPGLWTEETRTNSIRNAVMLGAAAGTPGTLPTNWTFYDGGGIVHSVVGSGVESGIPYVDIKWSGTATSANGSAVYFESATSIAALTGQTWSQSVFWKLVNGSQANLIATRLDLQESTSAGTNVLTHYGVNGSSLAVLPATPLGQDRVQGTVTLSGGATVGAVLPYFEIGFLSGAVVNLTVRVGLPQLELGASTSTPLPSAGTAYTRQADAVTLPLSIGTAVTIVASGITLTPTTYGSPNIVSLTDGTNNNAIQLFRSATGAPSLKTIASGVVGANAAISGAATWAQNALGKIAAASQSSDQRAAYAGAIDTNAYANAEPSGLNTLNFGSFNGATLWNGSIARVTIDAAKRDANGVLQIGTQP